MEHLAQFSSDRLIAKLHALARRSRKLEADLLACIGEVDARRLYLREGCASMFAYCVEVLHFSQAAAYKRIRAARAARQFPELLDAVRRGELHVTAVVLIAPHLTGENARDLIGLARHRTRDEIERLLADRRPKQTVPTTVRRQAALRPAAQAPAFDRRPAAKPAAADAPSATGSPRSSAVPLGQQRYCIRFTASAELNRQLRELTALMRHEVPDGDVAKILAIAIDRLHKQVRRSKFAETDRPRPVASPRSRPSRHVPAAIRRAVSKRDGERCTYVSPTGRRCTSREFLEFHHVEPWVFSRAHSIDGITLRCRAHNRYAAERDFGEAHIARASACGGSSASDSPWGESTVAKH